MTDDEFAEASGFSASFEGEEQEVSRRWQPGDEYVDFGRRTWEEAELLAADIVPRAMRADARAMVGLMDMLERNALKPKRRKGRR